MWAVDEQKASRARRRARRCIILEDIAGCCGRAGSGFGCPRSSAGGEPILFIHASTALHLPQTERLHGLRASTSGTCNHKFPNSPVVLMKPRNQSGQSAINLQQESPYLFSRGCSP